MANEGMEVKVDADKFQQAIERLPRLLLNELNIAGYKVSKLVLETEGVKKYPPLTTQKRDTGKVGDKWYERGRGQAYRTTAGVKYNETSERYGTQWGTQVRPNKVRLTNRASYGKYLGGAQQAKHMRKFGWRKIINVIKEKMGMIKAIYQGAIRKAATRAGFRVR